MKYKRRAAIMRIISENKIRTHEQLIYALKQEGFSVTQATVSRDIKEIGLIKEPSDVGSIYAISLQKQDSQERKIKGIAESVTGIDVAMNMIVIKTHPAMASAIGAAVDEVLKNEFLGSIAGDDVLLVIAKTSDDAQILEKKMKKMFGFSQ